MTQSPVQKFFLWEDHAHAPDQFALNSQAFYVQFIPRLAGFLNRFGAVNFVWTPPGVRLNKSSLVQPAVSKSPEYRH